MAAKKNIAAENGTAANRRVVLVGTYKGDQLTKWRGMNFLNTDGSVEEA